MPSSLYEDFDFDLGVLPRYLAGKVRVNMRCNFDYIDARHSINSVSGRIFIDTSSFASGRAHAVYTQPKEDVYSLTPPPNRHLFPLLI